MVIVSIASSCHINFPGLYKCHVRSDLKGLYKCHVVLTLQMSLGMKLITLSHLRLSSMHQNPQNFEKTEQ